MPDPHQLDITIIALAGPPGSPSLPLFNYQKSKKTKPNLLLSRTGTRRGPIVPATPVANGTFGGTLSTSVTINAHGETIKIKTNEFALTDSYEFQNAMGKFKWKGDSIAKNTMALTDGSGMTLARLTPGERLEVLVPCDDRFLDLVVISGLAAAGIKSKDKKEGDIIEGVLEAVLGG